VNHWPPHRCKCGLCPTLARFLASPSQTQLEWRLAKDDRRHVHGMLDGHELPVRHETRRSGRPFTLVLTKTRALFEREEAQRRRWQAELAWAEAVAGTFALRRTRAACGSEDSLLAAAYLPAV
jgi:hypothetical protein